MFYVLFYSMEDCGILDVNDEIHLMALHCVYLPRVQKHLDQFKDGISRRPLRTEGNKSPLQLWISGQLLDPRRNTPDVVGLVLFSKNYECIITHIIC